MSLLCIGGLDPLGRAGLLADRQACQAFGVEAQVVCSALTAQDDASCAVYPVDPAFFSEQLRVVLRTARPQVVKVGWLSDEAQVTELLRQVGDEVELIIDPLLRTSSGVRVYQSDWSAPSYARLLARADLLTPNLVEARELVGGTTHDPVELGSRLQQLGARRVLVGLVSMLHATRAARRARRGGAAPPCGCAPVWVRACVKARAKAR